MSLCLRGRCFLLLQCRQQRFRLRVIAKRLTDVDEQVFIAWSEDKTSAQLKRVFAQFVLFVTGLFGALAILHVVAAQEMKDISLFQLKGAVSFAIFVNQQWKSDMRFFAEETGVLKITQSNSGQGGAFLAELVLIFAQLRDMLSAEDSTVMAQENHYGRSGAPE